LCNLTEGEKLSGDTEIKVIHKESHDKILTNWSCSITTGKLNDKKMRHSPPFCHIETGGVKCLPFQQLNLRMVDFVKEVFENIQEEVNLMSNKITKSDMRFSNLVLKRQMSLLSIRKIMSSICINQTI
jgi:hypothetical protein